MGSARRTPTFSESFEVHHAIQVVISAAYRTRSSIDADEVVAAVRSTFPNHPASDADLLRAVVAAAEKAHVSVVTETAARQPVRESSNRMAVPRYDYRAGRALNEDGP
jgi:hypothetical protein